MAVLGKDASNCEISIGMDSEIADDDDDDLKRWCQKIIAT